MSTIKDVAALAGVSVGTVSNYMTGARSVSEEAGKAIQNAIDELSYRPNSYAKNLRASNNCEVGVILPNAYDQYYAFIAAGLERELRQAGYYMNLAFSGDVAEEENAILDAFMRKDVCGLIVISCQKDYHCYEALQHTPTVFIDRRLTQDDCNFVAFDTYETTSYLLSQLEQQGYGQSVALFAGPEQFTCEAESASAFYNFYKERGLTPLTNAVHHLRPTKEEAFRVGMEYFKDHRPQAVISTSRNITNGLEQALALLCISTSSDIRMISFGQENWNCSVVSNGILYTMRPAHWMGKKAAHLLIENMRSPLMFEKQQLLLRDKIIGEPLFQEPSPSISLNKKKKPLKILLLDSPNAHAVLQAKPDFTRKTGLETEIELCEHSALMDILLNKSEELSAFDVVMYDNPWLELLVRDGLLKDVTELVEAPEFPLQAFLPGLPQKVGMAGERYYGVPFLFGPQLLLYRKDLFENKQLQEQFEKKYHSKLRVPRTWFEFNVISSFFTQSLNPNSPVQYGTAIAAGNEFVLLPELMPRVWAYGGQVFNEKGTAATDSSSFTKGVANFIETFSYANPNARHYTVEQTVSDFYTGNIAMLIGFASFVADVNNESKSKVIGKIGYANIPSGYSVLGSWGLGIPHGCHRKAEAFSFIQWTCDPSMSSFFAIIDGQSPLETAYINDELANHYPWLPLVYHSYDTNRQRKSLLREDGVFLPITRVESVIYQYITAILQNQYTVQDALKRLNEEITSMIQQTAAQ